MDYFEQKTDYTCAVACMRMILSKYQEEIPSEEELSQLSNTTETAGTHPTEIIRVMENMGYDALLVSDSSLEELRTFVSKGYSCILLAQVDVPHCVVYLRDDNNYLWYNDPYYGESKSIRVSKFCSENQKYPFMRWLVEVESLAKYYSEFDLDLSKFLVGKKQFIAIKPKQLPII